MKPTRQLFLAIVADVLIYAALGLYWLRSKRPNQCPATPTTEPTRAAGAFGSTSAASPGTSPGFPENSNPATP